MGVSITGKYKNMTSPYSLAMSYTAFNDLRCTIAKDINKEFGEHYKKFARCDDLDNFFKKAEDIINTKGLCNSKIQTKVFDFLFSSDDKGKLSYTTCSYILSLIKNEPDDDIYGYPGWGKDCSKMKDFKDLLQDIANNKGQMIWS